MSKCHTRIIKGSAEVFGVHMSTCEEYQLMLRRNTAFPQVFKNRPKHIHTRLEGCSFGGRLEGEGMKKCMFCCLVPKLSCYKKNSHETTTFWAARSVSEMHHGKQHHVIMAHKLFGWGSMSGILPPPPTCQWSPVRCLSTKNAQTKTEWLMAMQFFRLNVVQKTMLFGISSKTG